MGNCSTSDSSYSIKLDAKGVNQEPSWLGKQPPSGSLTVDSFHINAGVGKGKFGVVFLSEHKRDGTYYAIKFISKEIIHETGAVDKIQEELNISRSSNSPFIVRYFGGFDTKCSIALVFEYCCGGELYTRMKQNFRMSESTTLFYTAELIAALHYLHDTLNVVYRDLKPENILIDFAGHIKLCDMGFAVLAKNKNAKDHDFLKDSCGTAMYVAPEIVNGRNSSHGYPVDWWALGCVVFEMATGKAPFGDTDKVSKFEIFNNVNAGRVTYPGHLSKALKEFIRGCLCSDPAQRFSWEQASSHVFTSSIDWEALHELRICPPWVPGKSSNIAQNPSTENFVDWTGLCLPGSVSHDAESRCRSLKIPAACHPRGRSNSADHMSLPVGSPSRKSRKSLPSSKPSPERRKSTKGGVRKTGASS